MQPTARMIATALRLMPDVSPTESKGSVRDLELFGETMLPHVQERAMNPKDRAAAYIALSKQLDQQYARRRSLEWKIHLAIWTLLVAAGYALLTYAPTISRVGLVVALAIMVFVHLVWAVKIHTGQFRDQQLSIVHREKAESILQNDLDNVGAATIDASKSREQWARMPDWLEIVFASYWWWLGAEVGTTVLMAVAVFGLAVSAAPRATTDQVSALQQELALTRTELTQLKTRVETTEARIAQMQQVPLSAPIVPGRPATRK